MAEKPSNVVFLAFSNPELEKDGINLMGCRRCRNKTFRVEPPDEGFPAMYCAACGTLIGVFGWADNDD